MKIIYGDAAVEMQGETAYTSFVGGFWSLNQASVKPYCIFKPDDTPKVSVVILLSRLTQCPFAVKSGGHAAFTGASNIEGGITVSLEKLNSIKLSSDKKTASIQPGNTWSQIYTELSKSDLTVIGGRVSKIGIGGLTTGGKSSLISLDMFFVDWKR